MPRDQAAQPDHAQPDQPDQAEEDTDAAWGDRHDPEDDDERYRRDRPPHWDTP